MEDPGTWPPDLLAGSGYNLTTTANVSTVLTCQQVQNEVGVPLQLSAAVGDILRYSQVAYFLVSLLLGVLMNSLVIALVVRFKRLKTAMFYLALQVIIVDLINALIIFPSSTANAIAKRNVFTHLCSALGFAIFFLRAIRTLIMSVLVIDRFCSIFMPYWYPRRQVKVIVTLSLVAWIAALVMSTIPIAWLLDCYGFQHYTWACGLSVGCKHQRACPFYSTITVILMRTSNIVALLLYLVMYCKARKLRNRVADISQFQQSTDARAERQGQECRANVTFFLLFLALIGVSFPSFFFTQVSNLLQISPTVRAIHANIGSSFQVFAVITRTLNTLLVIMDPIVIIRDRDAREVILNCITKLKTKVKQRKDNLGL